MVQAIAYKIVPINIGIDQHVEMKFLISLRWPIRVWQILGLAPFGVAHKPLLPVKSLQLELYTVVLLLMHFIFLILSIVFSSIYIERPELEIGNYDSFVAMIMIRLTACIIVGEAILKLNKQTNFLQQIIRVDFIMHRKLEIHIDYKKYQFQNNVFTSAWMLISCSCVVCVFIIFHALDDKINERFWLIYAVPFIIYSLYYHRVVFYVHEIRRRYQILNGFIEKICLFQERGVVNSEVLQAFKGISKTAYADCPVEQLISESQLKDIRNAYQLLYETTNTINDMLWWSLPLCIAIDFHRLLVNSYYIFAVWLLELHWKYLIVAVSWGGANIVHLILLSHACHSTTKEVSQYLIELQDQPKKLKS